MCLTQDSSQFYSGLGGRQLGDFHVPDEVQSVTRSQRAGKSVEELESRVLSLDLTPPPPRVHPSDPTLPTYDC